MIGVIGGGGLMGIGVWTVLFRKGEDWGGANPCRSLLDRPSRPDEDGDPTI